MVTLAKKAGYCFGVRRAVETALEEAAKRSAFIYAAGPLIHNQFVIDMLQEQGVVTKENLDDIPDGSDVILRAHGLPVESIAALQARGCHLIDATCPFVSKIHLIVEEESKQGRTILIFGKAAAL